MLAPRYLEGISDELVEIYSRLETDILADIARRVSRLSKVTDATKWQLEMLAEMGTLKKRIEKLIKNNSQEIQDEIIRVYNEALTKSVKADNVIFKEALGHGVSEVNAQIMLASIQKTYSDLSRLTLTTAATSERLFAREANAAYMQVTSGAFDYDTAMKNACDNLLQNGVKVVSYDNGTPVIRHLESAVRMNILTGVNQTAANITLNNCEELDVDLVETSAHLGARPSHEEWQGQIFSLSGNNKKYRPFSVCRLGEADGICGINCRHSYYPYIEGMERHYTQDDLDRMSGSNPSQKVYYNGKEYTRYEGEQELRKIERNIRQYKRRAAIYESGNVDSSGAKALLGKWQETARDFVQQTGLRRDYNREYVPNAKGEQVRGINPATLNFTKNELKAHKVHKLSASVNKQVAGVSMGAPMNFREADGMKANPNYKMYGGYEQNCQSCVVAYELRRRGYDVETLPWVKGSMLDVLSYKTHLAWIDPATGKFPEPLIPGKMRTKDMVKWLNTHLALDSRYTIEFDWLSGDGHIINIIKTKNGLSLYDPQSGKITTDIHKYLERVIKSSIKLYNVEKYDINLSVVNQIVKAVK